MSNLAKIQETMKDISNRCIVGFETMKASYNYQLKVLTDVMEKENEMAKLSNWSFVDAFRVTARTLAETLPEPNTESYIRFANEAIEMLARGNDPAEVLWYFDLKLERMKKGLK